MSKQVSNRPMAKKVATIHPPKAQSKTQTLESKSDSSKNLEEIETNQDKAGSSKTDQMINQNYVVLTTPLKK